jgi:hypothetical protein
LDSVLDDVLITFICIPNVGTEKGDTTIKIRPILIEDINLMLWMGLSICTRGSVPLSTRYKPQK